ncbi:E3 ubiquitin-protein ligase CIP8 [Impatiens glandulifera]|uniref:E3 ubiquitin-protein ligase CIP8 n=1 Tax=Impatiens glandulifera TaxID=253017 RepID=UPI001FB0ABD0|nr:E3 ubiquitin-protein ligase CIP8 [Impatiens glandulifera]XP_047334859.1 E3 ubiquitin-protein ligase CIP8 [Impatiens glandulifera]
MDDSSSRSILEELHESFINGQVDDPSDREACMLCHRTISPDHTSEELDTITMCGVCKFLFLEESSTLAEETPHSSRRRTSRRRRRRRRTRNISVESIDNLFSQQFSHLINMARNHDNQVTVEEDDATRLDTESDGFDSLYGESESNFSFNNLRLFPSESDVISFSDVSVDEHELSFLDIDPMNAALSQWDSDSEWEEAEFEENTVESRVRNSLDSPLSIGVSNMLPSFGNTSNLDELTINELLDRLADDVGSRRGAPPAAESIIDSLPLVVIGKEHKKKNDDLTCAICKEGLSIGTYVNQLPCFHVYHPSCIVPWLSSRNSCPLCRYELPTDDKDYEEAKRGSTSEIQHSRQTVNVDDDEVEIEEEVNEFGSEGVNIVGEKNEGSRSWFFLAAAPVFSLAGIALMMWFGKPQVPQRGQNNNNHRRPSW